MQDMEARSLARAALQCSAMVGEIKMYAGQTAPSGFLICDGSSKLRTDYPNLFNVIGTTYGSQSGTTFNLPDLRSRIPIGAGQGIFKSVFANTSVNVSTNVITVASNDSLYNGTTVVLTTTGTAPTGLTAGATYYVIRDSSTTIRLATNTTNASYGTAIDITGQGTGTHTLTVTYTNRVIGELVGEENHCQTIAELAAHTHQYSDTYSIQYSAGTWTDTSACDEIERNETTGWTGGSQPSNIMQPSLVVKYIIKF